MEVVNDAGVFELVDFIEDDDGSRAVVLLEAVDEFVVNKASCFILTVALPYFHSINLAGAECSGYTHEKDGFHEEYINAGWMVSHYP